MIDALYVLFTCCDTKPSADDPELYENLKFVIICVPPVYVNCISILKGIKDGILFNVKRPDVNNVLRLFKSLNVN
jgi:thermostable 8-oxoguanine DNA glycosylase